MFVLKEDLFTEAELKKHLLISWGYYILQQILLLCLEDQIQLLLKPPLSLHHLFFPILFPLFVMYILVSFFISPSRVTCFYAVSPGVCQSFGSLFSSPLFKLLIYYLSANKINLTHMNAQISKRQFKVFMQSLQSDWRRHFHVTQFTHIQQLACAGISTIRQKHDFLSPKENMSYQMRTFFTPFCPTV